MRVAIIDTGNIVQNIIAAESAAGLALAPGWRATALQATTVCGVGATDNGDGTYALPPPSVDQQDAANGDAIRAQAAAALAGLRQIAGSSGTLTGLQLSQAVRALAQAQIGVIRLALNQLDGTN